MFLSCQAKQLNVTNIQILMHWQYGTSGHSVVTGAYVFPAHFLVYINKGLIPTGLTTAHVTHVASELIGIALTGPKIHTDRIVKRFVDVIQSFEFIIPERWDVILNEFWCYRSGQLRPQELMQVCAMDQQ